MSSDFARVINYDNEEGEVAEDGFTKDQIKDAMVADRITSSYIGNIFLFLRYCMESPV
jgi:hypothetical protein